MKLSPHRPTHGPIVVAFGVWLRSVTGTQPLTHPVALPPQHYTRGCTSMHFGENQLSPRSISISPLSTSLPPVLQHWWVRASMDCHVHFTLLMDSSRGFGSHRRHLSPRSDSVPLRLPDFTVG